MTPQGEPISVEFLLDEPSFQPHHMPFIKNLGMLGIEATFAHGRSRCSTASGSTISISTWRSQRFSFSSTPGDSLRSYFSSQAAAPRARKIWPASPTRSIDALIEQVVAADDRPSLAIACRRSTG